MGVYYCSLFVFMFSKCSTKNMYHLNARNNKINITHVRHFIVVSTYPFLFVIEQNNTAHYHYRAITKYLTFVTPVSFPETRLVLTLPEMQFLLL